MKKLLVCTDGSTYAQVSCEYAAWIASRTGAAVTAIYVTDLRQFEVPLITDLSGSLGIQPYQGVMGQLKELEDQKAKVIGRNASQILEKENPGGESFFVHKTGLLVDSLEEMEDDCDLVILGKRGENADFAAGHLGSTMERVVRASSKPCLVTSRAYRPVRKVLLAYDAGKSCQKALKFLTENDIFRGLELHIVSVAEESGEEEDRTLERLRSAEKSAMGGNYSLKCQMLHGTVEEQIVEYVAAQDIDLLVMGAYGHNRIRHLLIGSTTTEMIRRCKIPVLLFR
ncbi:MAG: universal stress protein [Opitutales bacterium]